MACCGLQKIGDAIHKVSMYDNKQLKQAREIVVYGMKPIYFNVHLDSNLLSDQNFASVETFLSTLKNSNMLFFMSNRPISFLLVNIRRLFMFSTISLNIPEHNTVATYNQIID